MSEKFHCDRCDVVLRTPSARHSVLLGNRLDVHRGAWTEQLDFCEVCYLEFCRWYKNPPAQNTGFGATYGVD